MARQPTILTFPNPVNEIAARLVAAGVLSMALAAVAFDWRWLTIVLAYGFVARVLSGPTLSPLGRLVTEVIVPRLPIAPRPVPGPPKRFAQGMGVVFSATALVLTFGFDQWDAAEVVLALLGVAAFLEAALGLCLGCHVFRLLMRTGIIAPETCESCSDIWAAGRH